VLTAGRRIAVLCVSIAFGGGCDYSMPAPPDGGGWQAVSIGSWFGCASHTLGTVECWGDRSLRVDRRIGDLGWQSLDVGRGSAYSVCGLDDAGVVGCVVDLARPEVRVLGGGRRGRLRPGLCDRHDWAVRRYINRFGWDAGVRA
jgi:hypothetical protein